MSQAETSTMTISGPDPAEPNRGNTIPGPRLPEAFDYAAMARSSKQLTSGRWIPSSVPSESEDCQRAAPRYIHLTPPSSVDSPSQSSMDNPSTHSEESKVGNEPALNIDQAPATVACESLEPELERGEVGEEETAEIDGGPDVVPTGASNDEEDPSEYNLQIEGSEYDEEDKDEEDNDQGAKLNDLVRRAPKRLKQYSNYVYLMEHRMHHVEKQIRRLQGREDQLTPSKEKSEDGKTPAISEIKYVQWADFKSTYAEKKEVYAIEALVGPARYWYQRRSDEWTRKWDTHDDQAAAVNTEIIVPDGLETDEQRREEIPERIRISSRPLLGILSNICSSELQKPHVFLRPYKLFIRHDSEIRNVYSKLEAKWAQEVSGHPANSQHRDATVIAPPATSDQPDANSISTGTAHDQGSLIAGQEGSNVADDTKPETDNSPPPTTKVDEESAEDSVGSLKAFKDLKCLIAFMDRHLAPVVEGFRSRSRRHIQFHELWYLFKSGDVVHAPRKIDPAQAKRKGAKSADQGRYQTFIRVFGVNGGQPNLRGDEHISEQSSLKDRVNPFGLDGYYVEYDGENYGLGSVCVYIQPFEGAREITSLEAYPLEYADNHADIYGDLKARGNKFREAVEQKHMFYLGSTYANNPNGTQFSEALSQFSEHISSEVIVDFAQALKLGLDELVFRAGLDWIVTQLPSASYPDQFSEDYPITVWKDGNQKDVHRYRDDTIFNDDIIDLRSFKHHADTDPFLKAVADLDMEIGNVGYENLRDDDIVVLPSRVIGYVLRERRWALLDVQKLRPIPPKADGFRELKLPRGHKDMVQALVRSHSMRREIDAATQDSADFDVVRGKGRGLIILLHGVPGVGKTSTAECIAESTGKPLFPITCGDLGLTPPDVEKNLRGIFQLAQAWDCVLLLDEADVFLAQRTKTDIKRNALVSVFLRVLEYYMGILFLTTNRVGTFDEAFKSRIHISLYYPELSRTQSVMIWKTNLERVKKIDLERSKKDTIPALIVDEDEIRAYAEMHWDQNRNGVGQWNGRQIRNAFQTASALALYEAHMENSRRFRDDPDARAVAPRLRRQHFEKVALSTLHFDRYMEETLGKHDAEAAHLRGDRTDNFHFGGHPRPPPPPPTQGHSRHHTPSNRSPYHDTSPSQYPMSHGRPTRARMTHAGSPVPDHIMDQSDLEYTGPRARMGMDPFGRGMSDEEYD